MNNLEKMITISRQTISDSLTSQNELEERLSACQGLSIQTEDQLKEMRSATHIAENGISDLSD
jgi:hypothetical protein